MTPSTPTPRTLYVHDDLSEDLATLGADSPARVLGAQLMARLAADHPRVVVLTLAGQLQAVIARGGHAPFAAAVGIGPAGCRVAAELQQRTGWFPAIHRVDVWREENGHGDYRLAGPAPLATQLRSLAGAASVAVVDDTIFSGLTMRAVLAAVPGRQGRFLHAFCLRAAAESLGAVGRLAPVTAGIAVPGRLLHDVSFINARGLVRRGAIRRTTGAPLAFFERPEWMAAWFPTDHEEITALCRTLNALIEPSLAAG